MCTLAIALALALAGGAEAQVRNPDETTSVSEDAGPVKEMSRPLGDDSQPVSGSGTIGETSVGTVRSGSVRDAGARSMRSGPVSEMSVGPMREPRPPVTTGSMTEWSSGAVKQNVTDPLGTQISEPVRELRPLQEAMRARREQAQAAALTGAPVGELSPDEAAAVANAAEHAAMQAAEAVEPSDAVPLEHVERSDDVIPDGAASEDASIAEDGGMAEDGGAVEGREDIDSGAGEAVEGDAAEPPPPQ